MRVRVRVRVRVRARVSCACSESWAVSPSAASSIFSCSHRISRFRVTVRGKGAG